jgi:DAPG hydrolase PhiG domain
MHWVQNKRRLFKLRVPPPLPITWEMKDLSSAQTSSERLPDGRVRYRIEHELLRGVTPEMLVWWFRTFPSTRLAWNDQLVPMYRIWHPRDHVRCSVMPTLLDRAPGVTRGATVIIIERLGPKVTRTRARVLQMDESGLELIARKLWIRVGSLRHTFERTDEGTLYRSELVVGSALPGVGRLVNTLARRRLFPAEVGEAWLRHNVEEVGNFQFFLPELYEEARSRGAFGAHLKP